MKAVHRAVALAIAALATIAAPLEASAGPYGGRGGYSYGGGWGHGGGHGRYWGGVGLGVGLGVGIGLGAYYPVSPWYYPAYGYPVVVPAPVYEVVSPPLAPVAAKAAPDPVVYPNHGQSPAQTEADRQACNRWAMGQPSAVADASVFHRATLACLEGRGYTVK